MKVQDVMTKNPSTVTPDALASEAARIMKRDDVGLVPVIDDSRRLIGVVTDRDLAVRIVAEGRDAQTRVSDIMSADGLATCRADEEVDRVMETMASEQVRRVPIVDDRGGLIGIVSQADIVRKAQDDRKAEKTVEQISQPRA